MRRSMPAIEVMPILIGHAIDECGVSRRHGNRCARNIGKAGKRADMIPMGMRDHDLLDGTRMDIGNDHGKVIAWIDDEHLTAIFNDVAVGKNGADLACLDVHSTSLFLLDVVFLLIGQHARRAEHAIDLLYVRQDAVDDG